MRNVHAYRISNNVMKSCSEDIRKKNNLLNGVREQMIKDSKKYIEKERIHNPDIYFWDKHEQNGDYVMGWFIGDWIQFSRVNKELKAKVFEHLVVQTSLRSWTRTIKDYLKEKFTGEKPDPKTLNPYH